MLERRWGRNGNGIWEEVVKIMELGDKLKRRKNMEEVELRWKKMKKRREKLGRIMAAVGSSPELGADGGGDG